jgi:hypothetical protein
MSKVLFVSDYCHFGELSSKVCVRRYEKFEENGLPMFYVILMQPLPAEFDTVRGDLNVFRMQHSEKEIIEAARKRNEATARIQNMTYVIENFADTDVFAITNVFSRRHQMLANGLVFKLVKYDSDEINYVVRISFNTQLEISKF